jgi:hypothetical protein
MNKIIIETQYQIAMRNLERGCITGEDIAAIVQFQMKEYIAEGEPLFTQEELGVIVHYMMKNN